MLRIGIIIGSTRPGHIGEAVAKWVYKIAQKRSDAEFELVDIKDFNLPLLDEPVSPITERPADIEHIADPNRMTDTRTSNPRSASNHKHSQSNFSILPLLCHS